MKRSKLLLSAFVAYGLALVGAYAQTLTLPVAYGSTTVDSNGQLFAKGTFDGRMYLSSTYSTLNLNSAATGAGARMVWYPGKAAFMAGYVDGTEWNDGTIGVGSATFGLNNQNGGDRGGIMAGYGNISLGTGHTYDPVVFGTDNVAYGANTIAIGIGNTAGGDFNVAIGPSNSAVGYYSMTLGQFNTASAQDANAFGCGNTASGYGALALGFDTESTATASCTLGNACYAQAYGEIVVGDYNVLQGNSTTWVSTDDLFVVGNGTGPSARSNAMVVSKNGNENLQGVLTAQGGVLTTPASVATTDIPMFQ